MNKLKQCVLDHWYENLLLALAGLHNDVNIKAYVCAYCREYSSGDCCRCPVHNVTGRIDCLGSPYWGVVAALQAKVFRPSKLVDAIIREIRFLERA